MQPILQANGIGPKGQLVTLQHKQIEQMKKQVKHHRDALDFSAAWATAERQAERARQGAGGQ